MSAILHVKGIILTHLTAEPELKEAVLAILNNINNDLDSVNYDEDILSDATQEAIDELDSVLTGVEEVEEEEENPIIKHSSLLDNDDEAEQEAQLG